MTVYQMYKSDLAKALHINEVPEDVWNLLVDEGYVARHARAEEGAQTLEYLVEKAKPLLKLKGIELPEAIAASASSLARIRDEALAQMVREEIDKNTEVQAFRQKVLNGKLLAPADLEQWIQGWARRELPPTWWLLLSVPRDYQRDALGLNESGVPLTPRLTFPSIPFKEVEGLFQIQYLDYLIPCEDGEYQIRLVSTTVGGVLERLRVLSDRLGRQYGWLDAEMTTFVLTGLITRIGPITHTFRYRQFPGLPHIVLDIEAGATTEEVAQYHRQIRQQLLGTNTNTRGPSEKNARLVAFIAQRPRLSKSETWAKRMEAWNAGYPQWTYTSTSNLQRDFRRAQARLLMHKGKGNEQP